MPSGAKKRKAAKKKKESQADPNGSTNSSQGTDQYVMSQDEKDSDVGDVNSPPSEDKEEHENPFRKGTELVHEGDHSAIPPVPADNNSIWGEEINGPSKDGLMKNSESVDVSNDRNGEQSTVTLVDRSRMYEKNLQEESSNPVIGAVTNDDFVRTSDSSFIEVAVANKPFQKAVSMVSGSTLRTDKPVVVLSEFSSQVTEHSPTRNLVINMENETPAAQTDLTLKKEEDKSYPSADVNVEASSSGVEHKPERYDSAELPPSHPPVAVVNSSNEYVKDSGIPECSENQPLVVSAPRMVERTSWLSCCGLFDLLSGSNK